MKKRFYILLLLLLFTITGCTKKEQSDAIKFKEDYEKLNEKATSDGKNTYRKITINSNNPMIYSNIDNIVEKINNKETFIVYFGFSSCPWCRSIIPYLIEEANNLKIDKIYYVNVRSDNTKKTDIRGYKKLNDKNEVEVEIKAVDSYYNILEALDSFLTDYTLEGKNKEQISTGEKRLYAPTIAVFKNGIAVSLTEGISDLQTDAYMDLTDKIINDSKNKIRETLSYYK